MIKNIYRWYCRIEVVIVGIGFASIVALTFSNAVLRQLNMPISTVDDICLLLFGWVAFAGADVAMRYSRLVGMDILTAKLPAKPQKVIQLVVFVIMIVALAALAYYGFSLAISNWSRSFSSNLPFSYGFVTLSLPICSLLMILTASIKVGKVLINFKDDSYNVRKDNPDIIGEENTGLEDSDEPVLLG